jgi:hypothetical protein
MKKAEAAFFGDEDPLESRVGNILRLAETDIPTVARAELALLSLLEIPSA